MNLLTKNQDRGKELPAEMTAAFRGSPLFARNRLGRNADRVQQRGGQLFGREYGQERAGRLSGLGFDWDAATSVLNTASQNILPIIVAQNPGTIYETDANGNIRIYSQPTGNTQNLPVYSPGLPQTQQYPYYPQTAQQQVGGVGASASVGGNSLLIFGGIALVAILLMKK